MVTTTGSTSRIRAFRALAALAAVGVGLASSRVAEAGANLTFTLAPQSGNGRISYAGGQSALTGDGLGVASVNGLSTPSHAGGALAIDAGALKFATGNPSQTNAATKAWDFGPGGKLELDGGIAALGIKPGTALLTGSFTQDTFVRSIGTGDLKLQGGAFFNVVNPTLAAYFGLPTGGTAYLGGLGTLFSAPTNAAGGFSSLDLTSGSVTTSPVPEPGTLAIFAALTTGGLALAHRRRNQRGR